MKYLLLFFPLLFQVTAHAGLVKGKIGEYPIVMEIQEVAWETGEITGRYRYANKKSFLQLRGNLLQNIIWLEEQYENEVTGAFYLSFESDTIKGKWVAGKTWYEVELYPTKKDLDQLKAKSLKDYQTEVSESVSGGYANEHYFINDMWFRTDNPQLEIGFSGGALVLEKVHPDSIQFWVNTVAGPTYHIAYATGIAHKNEDGIFEYLVDAFEGDSCVVYIEPQEKKAHVWAHGNFICGFGARAYLDHEFIKITDRFLYEEDHISIEQMKR